MKHYKDKTLGHLRIVLGISVFCLIVVISLLIHRKDVRENATRNIHKNVVNVTETHSIE